MRYTDVGVRENTAWLICENDTNRPSFNPFSTAETAEADASIVLQHSSVNKSDNISCIQYAG